MKNKSKTAFFVKAICLILAVADFLPLLFSCDVDPDITEPLSEKVSDTGQTPETESGATMTSDVEIPDIDTDGLEFTMHDDDHKFLGYGYDEKKVYPADMFSAAPTESRSYFETKNGVGISQDPAYMKENYAYNTVELIKDGDGYKTLWKFKTRNFGVLPELTIDMGCNYFIFDSVSFTVENKSDGMLKFSMKTSEFNAQPVSNPKTGTFSAISSGYVQGNETKKVFLDFTQSFSKYELLPVTTGSIYVSPVGVVQDKAYEIVLSGFSISFKQNAEVTGCAVKLLESSARPGDTVRLAIGATGVKPSDDVTVEFVRNEEYCFRVRLTDAEKKTLSSSGVLGITTVIPSHASTGDYKAVAVVNGYRVKDSVPGEISVSNDGPFDFPKMEVVKENGVPAIRKNGEPFLWDGVANGTLTPGIAYEFGENGSTVYMFEASLSSHNYGHSAQPTWLGPDKWDYSAIEELACAVMEADENAHLVIRLYFSLPAFWLLDNPDEAVLGTSDGKNYFRDVEYIGNEAVSLASKKWLDEEIRQLGLFMDYVKTRPWAERLIGIYLGGAVTTEWFAFFHNTNGVWGDYSEVNRQAFEDWGKTDNGKLLASLDPKTVTVPTPAQRIGGPYSIKPDTADSLLSAAYSQYISDKCLEVISTLADKVKEKSDGKLLCGALYGYMIQFAGSTSPCQSGTLSLENYLGIENVDFLSGIPLIDYRDPMNGYDVGISLTRSIQAAGKLYVQENDEYLWTYDGRGYPTQRPADDGTAGGSDMLTSTFGYDMIYGNPRHYFGLFSSWHHSEVLCELFTKFNQLRTEYSNADRTPAEEVAFLSDDESYLFSEESNDYLYYAVRQQLKAAGRSGAAVGAYLLSDIDKLPDSVKVVIVAVAYAPTKDTLEKLKNAIDKGGKTFVVIGPVGLIDTETGKFDPDMTRRITGVDVSVEYLKSPKSVSVARIGGSAVSTPAVSVNPLCTVDGGSVTGTYGEGLGDIKALPDGGKLVFLPVPVVSSKIWREIFAECGVTLTAPEGFYVHASRELVSVTAARTGSHQINLGDAVKATDILTGESFEGQSFKASFYGGQTRIFHLEYK